MSHVSTTELAAELEAGDRNYLEVLSEDSMRVELARYPNPAPKNPHAEDEIYYIVSGSGTARIGDETHAIEEGDVLYVERGVDHDFFDIETELTALIIFAGSRDSPIVRDR